VDVAIALDNFAPTPELERVLLRTWLGHEPSASLSDRLAKARALTRLYYAGVLLSASAQALGPVADGDLSTPSLAAFCRAIEEGNIVPGSAQAKHALGKMYLASSMTGEPPPGLGAAV
jgi:hypothetical protein